MTHKAETMKRVYLAGPFFNETEVKNIEKTESVLEGRGFDLFSPMRHEETRPRWLSGASPGSHSLLRPARPRMCRSSAPAASQPPRPRGL